MPNKPVSDGPAANAYIAALPAYNAGMSAAQARHFHPTGPIAALASNENPFGFSPMVAQALIEGLPELSRYSDSTTSTLRTALAAHTGVAADRIVVGNGSEELIGAIARAFLRPDQEVLTVTPSFGLHEIEPLAMGARVRKVPLTADMRFDIDALMAALTRKPAIFFLPTPSNPAGCAVDADGMRRLLDACPNETLFVIDEAYFEFADDDCQQGLQLLMDSGRHGVVLRTFSKAYGLAGLRVGYGLCTHAHLPKLISAATTPFHVNAAAQMAARAALADQPWMLGCVVQLKDELRRVCARLEEINVFFVPSQANFIFVNVKDNADELARQLLADGVIVKPWRESGYDNWIRVSIGSKDENDQFLTAFRHP